ncbi:MAG: hypothetical protein ACAH59_03075 [Pseudobdellovibrionaceae bacterium]
MRLKTIISSLVVLGSLSAQALQFDQDVPEKIQKQMLEDLAFTYQIQGSKQTPYHQKIFSGLSGDKYKTFFESRIKSVGVDSCGGGAAVACVQPFFASDKMWLTENFIKFSHPQVARTMVVYHESRHTEKINLFWSHNNCPTPFVDENGKEMKSIWTGAPLAGEPACDSTAFGSYGSSTIMLKNISKYCENCFEKVKMDADLYATDQLGRIHKADVKKAMLDDFSSN